MPSPIVPSKERDARPAGWARCVVGSNRPPRRGARVIALRDGPLDSPRDLKRTGPCMRMALEALDAVRERLGVVGEADTAAGETPSMLPSLGQTKPRSVQPVVDADSRPKRRFIRPQAAGLLSLLAAAIGLCGGSIQAAGTAVASESAKINFDRDIRPIFSDTCYACHGPDDAKRKAGLRLDQRKSAFARRDEGPAIVPGDPSQSALYRRITSHDKDERMPPPDSGRQLSSEQIGLIGRWIKQGAVWNEHWSLVAPKRRPAPHVAGAGWLRNPIDGFVLSRLEREWLCHPRRRPTTPR